MSDTEMAKFGEAMRGLTVFISDIRNCEDTKRGGDGGMGRGRKGGRGGDGGMGK